MLKIWYPGSLFLFHFSPLLTDATYRTNAILCADYWLRAANSGRGILWHNSGAVPFYSLFFKIALTQTYALWLFSICASIFPYSHVFEQLCSITCCLLFYYCFNSYIYRWDGIRSLMRLLNILFNCMSASCSRWMKFITGSRAVWSSSDPCKMCAFHCISDCISLYCRKNKVSCLSLSAKSHFLPEALFLER